MNIGVWLVAAIASALGVAALFTAGWERPPIEAVQVGYRGLGMAQLINPRLEEELEARNRVPEPIFAADTGGPLASEVYENVQVLGDLSEGEFIRLMTAITEWVSPEQGCLYCHNEENLAADTVYTKVVSRRMLQMTAYINGDWQDHVSTTGVTCYTCHRGKPVPSEIWFIDPDREAFPAMVGYRAGQNLADADTGYTSLPYDPFTPYLSNADDIRVISTYALPRAGERASIQHTEQTYGLMMHMSRALGVNCTACHNSRSFFAWDQSTPLRTTAWHGIRMVRDVNQSYLQPLAPVFPRERLGPLGDVGKVNCATCHRGLSKPLYGAPMAQDYPELQAAGEP